MYIAQRSFKSVHGRYYAMGTEVSWLWYQLMAQTDKKYFVKKGLYVSSYEEEYRQELQERDGEANAEMVSRLGGNLSYPVGGEWTPDEDIMHFPSQRAASYQGPAMQDLREESTIGAIADDLSSQIAGWEQSPSADDISDESIHHQQDSPPNENTHESSEPTTLDSTPISDTNASDSSSSTSSNGE